MYNQHQQRLDQVLDWHRRLTVERKYEVDPGSDIRPMIVAIGADHRAFQGTLGPLTMQYSSGEGFFTGRGITSMLIIYAQSVLELMHREDFEPVMIGMSNEGYIHAVEKENDDDDLVEMAAALRKNHKLGDFAKDYASNPQTKVREALMTTIVSFPMANEDGEPSYSLVVQPFKWDDGGVLVLDKEPTDDSRADTASFVQVGLTNTATGDTNQDLMVKMIWSALKAKRAGDWIAEERVQ